MDRNVAVLLLFLPACLFLQGCFTYPVVGCFDNYNELFEGTVSHNAFTGTAQIEVQGVNTKVKGRGYSRVTYVPPFSISSAGQRGEASLHFDDGRVVTAHWTALSLTTGYGIGTDQHGNSFTFTFGMSDREAEAYIARMRKIVSERPDLPPAYKPKEVRKERGFSSGTGFYITEDGHVITSFHVVEDAKEITVKNNQGEEQAARYVRGDSANDLALLRVEKGATPIPVAPYANVSKGDEVFTLGYPLVQIQGQEQKATFGRVNALSGVKDDVRFLQVDVPIQPGNSGGPLINKNGHVIGVTTATLDLLTTLKESGSLPQNVNYAVKSDYLIPLVRDYIKHPSDQTRTSPTNYDVADLIKKVERSVVLIIAK